jgi:hypothetical protein
LATTCCCFAVTSGRPLSPSRRRGYTDVTSRSDPTVCRDLGQGGPELLNPGDRLDGGRAIRGRRSEALSEDVRPMSGALRRPPLPGTSRTTARTTPVAIVSVMADVLGRTQVSHCASVVARGDRDGNRSVDRAAGLPARFRSAQPVAARLPSPARRLPESSSGAVAVAKTLAGATWPVAKTLATGCRPTWPVARGLATGLPAGGRAPAGVGHHRTRTQSPVANQITKILRKSLGRAIVLASVPASAPEQAAHQHPRVREAARS